MTLQAIEDRLIEIALVGAAVTSVALNIVGVDVKWYIPGIFLALYGIFRTLTQEGHEGVGLETHFYINHTAFYAAAQKQMNEARSHIWVTYTRSIPPPERDSAEASSYFRYTVDWARKNPEREFRRIMTVTESPAMKAWLRMHHGETKDIANYKVRVVSSAGPVDEIGIAIIDAKRVFLAFSGDGISMSGHIFETPEAIRSFREYYLQKWSTGESLEEYVRKLAGAEVAGHETSP
jgi:hypothetical protein